VSMVDSKVVRMAHSTAVCWAEMRVASKDCHLAEMMAVCWAATMDEHWAGGMVAQRGFEKVARKGEWTAVDWVARWVAQLAGR